MEEKRLFIVGMVMIVIGAITVGVLYMMRTKTKLTSKIVKVEYTFGSNYGTKIDTADITITIESDGKVTLNNDYHKDFTKTYVISNDKYDDLIKYIEKNLKVFDKKDRSDNNVMDGGSSYIKVTLEDGTIFESGGSNPSGSDYEEMEKKIVDTIDWEMVDIYRQEMKILGE